MDSLNFKWNGEDGVNLKQKKKKKWMYDLDKNMIEFSLDIKASLV